MTMMMTRTTRPARTFGEGLMDDETTWPAQEVSVTPTTVADRPTCPGRPSRSRRADKFDGQLTVDQFNFLTHDAIVTITNPATGQHRTFKIETLRKDWNPGKRMVSVLIGSDNTSDRSYKNFAFIETDEDGKGSVKVWERFSGPGTKYCPGTIGPDGKFVPTVYDRYARMIESPAKFAGRGVVYQISGRCKRCGRRLTRPESIADSIGSECRKKGGV